MLLYMFLPSREIFRTTRATSCEDSKLAVCRAGAFQTIRGFCFHAGLPGTEGDVTNVLVVADRSFRMIGMKEALLIDQRRHRHRLRAIVPNCARSHPRIETASPHRSASSRYIQQPAVALSFLSRGRWCSGSYR